MELLQEEFTGSNDHSPLIKRKRAKRKTPLSPPTTVTSSSSTGSAHGETCLPIPSPTSSGNNSATKEEDEDMANCLILLAQGGQKSDSSLYDCKTCNRTFPSFQALGGHRASHKKPKSDIEQEEEEGKEEETKVPKTHNKTITSPPFPFHSETKKAAPTDHNKSSSKAHGCSICGVVFSSGQALGGHMRRHRAPPPSTPRVSTSGKVNSTAESREADDDEQPRKFTSTLDLDLNLPAPFEDDFEFVASKRRFVLVSGPALVDCYY